MQDKIKLDLNAAMKAGDSLRVSVLRMLISELGYKRIDKQSDLTDEDVTGVIGKEVKKRREAIESYRSGNRPEQAQNEQLELEILQAYLPEQMSELEIEGEVIKLIKGLSDEEKNNFGQVMKAVSPQFRGKADGKVVAEIVKKLLSD